MDAKLQRRSLIWALVIIAFLLVYIFSLFQHAIMLVSLDDWVARVMGIVLLLFPLLGLYTIWAEVSFARGANKLIGQLAAEEGLPTDDLPVRPSGRADRDVAEQRVPGLIEAAEADPNWRSLLRLGLMQDAAGHRSDGRRAITGAIRMARAEQG